MKKFACRFGILRSKRLIEIDVLYLNEYFGHYDIEDPPLIDKLLHKKPELLEV
ncbi:MAG: hypothetical protein LBM77_13195 [Spirochaetaceae bacterium]|jgi:hypothetical protein|nr:hypothetical protein [Spirochaetaceae bacterium]